MMSCFSCYRVVLASRTEEESSRPVQRQHHNSATAQGRQDFRTCRRHLETTQGDGERPRKSPVRTLDWLTGVNHNTQKQVATVLVAGGLIDAAPCE